MRRARVHGGLTPDRSPFSPVSKDWAGSSGQMPQRKGALDAELKFRAVQELLMIEFRHCPDVQLR